MGFLLVLTLIIPPVEKSHGDLLGKAITENSDMSDTNKALAVLHNSDLFSMTPPLPSSFNANDTELHEREALSHHDITELLFYYQTQTLKALFKAVILQLTFYTNPLIYKDHKQCYFYKPNTSKYRGVAQTSTQSFLCFHVGKLYCEQWPQFLLWAKVWLQIKHTLCAAGCDVNIGAATGLLLLPWEREKKSTKMLIIPHCCKAAGHTKTKTALIRSCSCQCCATHWLNVPMAEPFYASVSPSI